MNSHTHTTVVRLLRMGRTAALGAFALTCIHCTGYIIPPGGCVPCTGLAPGHAYPLFDWRSINNGVLPQSYGYVLDDGDGIQMDVADGAAAGVQPNQVRITLITNPSVTWYKGVFGWNQCNGQVPGLIVETQDNNHGPVTMTVSKGQCSSGVNTVVFSKAKLLGVHSNMYHLATDQFWPVLGGKIVTLTWITDNSSDHPAYPPPCAAPCIPLTPAS